MAETLGRTLEEARRTLGISLTDAESQTFIRAKLLAALEAGEYDALPDPAYVRGYIQNYAKLLRLEPAPLLALYERETGTGVRQPISLPKPVVTPRPHLNTIPPKTALVIVVAVGLLALAVWGAARLAFAPDPSPPLPPSFEVTPTAEPASPPDSVGQPTTPGMTGPTTDAPSDGSQETPSAGNGDPRSGPFTVRVVIGPGAASWMRVTIDGLIAYEGTLIGGDTREWDVAEEAALRIGRPSAVSVYRDDVAVEIPPGDPPTLVLAAE